MKKWFSPGTVVGALVIGVLGSAIWENIFKPSSNWILNILVSTATLGIKSFQNDIYLEIAKGLHEDLSLRIIILLYTLLLSILVVTALLFVILQIYKNKSGLRESKFYSITKSIFDSKIFFAFYFIIAFVFVVLDISRAIYINQSVTYYNQIKTITLPYMTDDQSKIFDSNFAQITSSNDYEKVTNQLELIAQTNKLTLPTKPTLVDTINYSAF